MHRLHRRRRALHAQRRAPEQQPRRQPLRARAEHRRGAQCRDDRVGVRLPPLPEQSLGLGGLDRGREPGVGAEGRVLGERHRVGRPTRRRPPRRRPARPCARRPWPRPRAPGGRPRRSPGPSAPRRATGRRPTPGARARRRPPAPASSRCAAMSTRRTSTPRSRRPRLTHVEADHLPVGGETGQEPLGDQPGGSRNGDGGHVHRLTAWSTPLKATTTERRDEVTVRRRRNRGNRPEPVRGARIPGPQPARDGPGGLRPHPAHGDAVVAGAGQLGGRPPGGPVGGARGRHRGPARPGRAGRVRRARPSRTDPCGRTHRPRRQPGHPGAGASAPASGPSCT